MADALSSIEKGPAVLTAVRAGFLLKGTTMTRWCQDNNIVPQNARSCLLGAWDGPKGREIRARLIAESGCHALLANAGRQDDAKQKAVAA